MSEKELIIPNVHEFVIGGFREDFPENQLSIWRDLGAAFAEPAHFWGQTSKRLILAPRSVEAAFTQYACKAQGLEELRVFSPEQYSSHLCRCIARDEDLIRRVLAWTEGAPCSLLAWGATPDLSELTARMHHVGIHFIQQDFASGDRFTACRQLDSKTALRRLISDVGRYTSAVRMPRGWIVEELSLLPKTIRNACVDQNLVFVKTDLGVGGIGIHVESLKTLPEQDEELTARLKEWVETLPYPPQGPYVVEQEASHPNLFPEGIRTGSYFTNGVIDAQGRYSHLGAGVEIRSATNMYQGAIIGNWAPLRTLYRKTATSEVAVAEIAARLKYMGHLGLDFLFDHKDMPLILEANPRRCCESHVYDLGSRLFGSDWTQSMCALSRLPAPVEMQTRPTIAALTNAFSSVTDTVKSKSVAALLSSQVWLEHINPGIGYFLFAPDIYTLRELETRLWFTLNSIGLGRICKKGVNHAVAPLA